MYEIVIAVFLFSLGAIFGSFLNVVIYRLPQEQLSIVWPRSFCPSCKAQIAWYDNIPIVSYIILRAHCRKCAVKIPLRYPLVELIFGLVVVCLYIRFGVSIELIEGFVFSFLLLAIGFIDLDSMLIPVILLVFLIAAGVFFSLFHTPVWPRALGAVLGFSLLAAVLVIATFILRKTGRLAPHETAMGWGDPLLLAGIGAHMGILKLPLILTLGSFQGVIFGFLAHKLSGKQGNVSPLPFGTFLALGALETLLIWGF